MFGHNVGLRDVKQRAEVWEVSQCPLASIYAPYHISLHGLTCARVIFDLSWYLYSAGGLQNMAIWGVKTGYYCRLVTEWVLQQDQRLPWQPLSLLQSPGWQTHRVKKGPCKKFMFSVKICREIIFQS